jgi:hypothetical protein
MNFRKVKNENVARILVQMHKVPSPKGPKNIRGRVISAGHVVTRESANVAVRPLKLAFLINEKVAISEVLKVIEYNSSVWGGLYNPLIPTDGQSLRSDWWYVLIAQSPDKIVLCGEATQDLLLEIKQRVEPYCFWEWQDGVLDDLKSRRDVYGSVPLAYKLFDIYESSRPISKSNFRIVRTDGISPYSICASAQFGIVGKGYDGIFEGILKATPMEGSVGGIDDYLNLLSALERRITPIIATGLGLNPSGEMSETGFNLVLCGENIIADICLFWDLRMYPSFGRTWTFILPASSLLDVKSIRALGEWCNNAVVGTNYVTVASASMGRRGLLELRKRLKRYLKKEIEKVDIWFDGFDINHVRLSEMDRREELVLEDQEFRISVPGPSFGDEVRVGEWVVDMRLGEGIGHRGSKFLPPNFNGLTRLLSGSGRDQLVSLGGATARMANDSVSYLVRHRQETLAARLPSDDELFEAFFESKGFYSKQTDKCRYARGLTKLIGGSEGLKIWRDQGVRDLFCAMSDGTRSRTPREMMSYLKPGHDLMDHSHSMVADLALKKVFLRGYKLQCPACDLTRWYAITEIAEAMPCSGCLTPLQPPIEASFSYRLNDLVARGVGQGNIPLMLTVLFLEALAETSFLFVPGMEVSRSGSADIDIDVVASCDGHLILAECKDLRGGASRKTIENIVKQFEMLVQLAVGVGAKAVFLSVLEMAPDQRLSLKVEGLRKKWKKLIAVHLLTGNDLEQGFRMKPLSSFRRPGASTHETRSTLRDFLPQPPRRKSGLIRARGDRSISF